MGSPSINIIIRQGLLPETQRFIVAAGISLSTHKQALNGLVRDLKASSLWDLILAIYPFVGGNATAHSYNLIDPSKYRITFAGTVDHVTNPGITGNGSTGWGDTGFPGTVAAGWGLGNMSMFFYSRTNINNRNAAEMGRYGGIVSQNDALVVGYSTVTGYNATCGSTSDPGIGAVAAYNGFLQGVATGSGSTALRLFVNGALNATGTRTSGGTLPSVTVGIMARKDISFGPGLFSNNNIMLAGMSAAMTDGQASSLYSAVQNFHLKLGRNV